MTTNIKVLPAPTGGWNARDPLYAMAENEAIEIENFFPDVANVVNRGGSVEFGDIAGGCVGILNIMPLSTGQTNPTHDLIVNTNMGSGVFGLYRVNGSTGAATDIHAALTIQAATWIGTIFNGDLFIVDGFTGAYRVPKYSGNAVDSGWSGVLASTLTNVSSYKGRLYYIKGNSVWYPAAVGSITGALTEFAFNSQLTLGGTLLACGSTSKTGNQPNNFFVAVSQFGEVLVYQGDYPGADTWSKVGHYFIDDPLGKRCLFYKGADLHILTASGVIPIGNLLNGVINENGNYATISDKIQPAFVTSVLNNIPATSSMDWCAVNNPYHKSLIIGGPKTAGGVYEQIVQNSFTQAWTKYTGIDSPFWASYGEYVYCASRTTGKIYRLGKPGSSANVDITTTIQCGCRQACNFLDKPTIKKQLTQGKLFFDLVQATGHSQVTREVQLGVDVDFADDDSVDDVILGPIATDGTTHYSRPVDVRGDGTAFSLVLKAKFGGGYQFAWNLSMLESEPSQEGLQ